MADLPTGTVTFLFTDIEGSTRLLESLGARYAEVLEEHQRIVRAVVGETGGREIDTQGDAFFVAFSRAKDAAAAALAAQSGCKRTNGRKGRGCASGWASTPPSRS